MSTIFASKFVQTIKTFSEDELKSFGHWLRSPWCNTNKNVPKLFDKLKKYYPAFDYPKLTKEKLFKQVLPKGKFSDRRMNNLLSEGYLVAEQFLIFNNLSKNQNLQKDLLTQELQNRHLEDWFFRDVQKEIDRLETKPVKDWEDHLDLLRLHRRVYHHPNQKPRMQPGGQTIVKMGKQLDLVYLLEKAAIINEKIFRKRFLKDENHDIESELKIWLSASEEIEHLAVKFYRMRFSYQKETMLEQYFELRKNFLERYKELNEKEQKIHLLSLMNDTNLFVKKRKLSITEQLPILKLGLNTKILLDKGRLSKNTYTLVIGASNFKKDFEFTNQFITNYTSKVNIEYQEDAKNWALTHTLYYQEAFTDALDILINCTFTSLYFKRIAKVLQTQIYFDLFLQDDSYFSLLFNYFDAFEKWILREKQRSNFSKKPYLVFVQKCRALAKHYTNANFQIDKISNLLKNQDNVQSYQWLENKKDAIINLKNKGHLTSK